MSGRSPRWISTKTYVKLGTLQPGIVIKLSEAGGMAEFYIGEQDYESALNGTGRTLLVRKDCYDLRNVNPQNDARKAAYADSDLDIWLNNTYLGLLDSSVQAAIGTTKLYCTPRGSNDKTVLERSVFQLSLKEFGLSDSDANADGTGLQIAKTLRVCYYNAQKVEQWTRTQRTNNGNSLFALSSSGSKKSATYYSTNGSRPAFTLPAYFSVTEDAIV